MNVLLISANTLTEPYPVYPLGLDYVAAAIADRHEVRIADMNTLKGDDALLAGRASGNGWPNDLLAADIIGISLRNIDNTDTTDPKGFFNAQRELIEKIRVKMYAQIILNKLLEIKYGISMTSAPIRKIAKIETIIINKRSSPVFIFFICIYHL